SNLLVTLFIDGIAVCLGYPNRSLPPPCIKISGFRPKNDNLTGINRYPIRVKFKLGAQPADLGRAPEGILKTGTMEKLNKEDIKQEVFELYDAYAHNKIQRREFIERLGIYAVGGITVASLMGFLMPNYLETALVDKQDPNLESNYITYNSPEGGGEI